MNNGTSTTPTPKARWWRYAIIAMIVGGVGGLIAVLAANGTLRKVFSPHAHRKSATGQLWTCGMHPQVIQDHPGDCPICHMELTPLKGTASTTKAADERSGGPAVTIDPVVVQNMGVRTAKVTQGPLRSTIRAVGVLKEAQPNRHDVNLRLSGWIEKLYAHTEGMHVSKGDPLFDLYSPQLQVAVEELIGARKATQSRSKDDDITSKSTAAISRSAEQKLMLLGLERDQVDRLAKLDQAPRTITFTSPITGHVTETDAVEGAAVKEGQRVLRIVDHSKLWLDAQIYESQLPFIRLGQKATATIESLPGKPFDGEVIFIHPHVDPMTRTVMVRLVLPNESLTLKPGMYGTVLITAQLADQAVLVPREAVIDTGSRQIAFLAAGNGHFEPRKVTMGALGQDGMVQVLDGLTPGQTVVTSGQFLLDAESRLKEAIQKHLSDKLEPATVPSLPIAQAHSAATSQLAAAPATHAASGPVKGRGEGGDIEVDAAVKAYLELSDALGKPQKDDQPLDVQRLLDAAEKLSTQANAEQKPLAEKVVGAAGQLKGQPIQQQRKLFKPLSEAVVALVEKAPPTGEVADKLFVMHCPMADGNRGADWLQTTPALANPYFATSMKSCGEVKRAIDLPNKR
jgi:Cu(I)/Ag(I) efflux system membrane fusion protein